jgi:hypothetical protein
MVSFKCELVKDDSDGGVSITGAEPKESTDDLIIPETIHFDGKDRPVSEIARIAFDGSKTRKVTFPASLKAIRGGAFENAKELAEIVFAPNGKLALIDHGAFYQCEGLTQVDLPPTLEELGIWVFKDCKNLKKVTIDVNAPLKTIGDSCFEFCSLQGEFVVPKAIAKIDDRAFRGNKDLTSVVIDVNSPLTWIGSGCVNV